MNTKFSLKTKLFWSFILVATIAGSLSPRGTARTPTQPPVIELQSVSIPSDLANSVERAMTRICDGRRKDALGTIPIDDMAFAPPLPLTDSRVNAGKARATALLSTAKRLVPFAVRRVAIANGVEPKNLKWMITRVQAVTKIRADVQLHDNATWQPSEPDTITFGTIFLAGLRSEEAMLAVLGHELTHAINGTNHGLTPVISRLSSKAQRWQSVSSNAAIELTCEMVGLETVRDYISQTKRRKPGTEQRLGRALHKDCVQKDLSDQDHLSPRQTMRLLLQLDVELLTALNGQRPSLKNVSSKTQRTTKKPVKKVRTKKRPN